MKKIFLVSIMSLVVTACGSAAKKPTEERPIEAPPEEIRIDYVGLQQTLGIHRPDEKLGYVEKAFDTCTVGNGFSHSEDCHREYFVLMYFQLKCRDTEEAPADGSPMSIRPIANHPVAWALDSKRGVVHTDFDGYSQIRTSFRTRPRDKHIKLTSDTHFLYVKAGDLDQIVAPPNWCQ
jgi:hypothetical protein